LALLVVARFKTTTQKHFSWPSQLQSGQPSLWKLFDTCVIVLGHRQHLQINNMPTTGPVNGTLISIYKDVSGTLKKIANATSNSLDISKDMIDVTSKDSAGAKEFIAGEYGYTLNVEAIFEDDSSVGATQQSFKDLATDLLAGTLLTIVMSSNVTGDEKYSGTAFFTSLSLSAPNNDKATWTGTLQGSGALTIGTVA
jgi:predicted secreted protein